MSEAAIQEVVTETFVETSSKREKVSCQKCGSGKVRRVYRDGFLQTNIYPLLGYYPWRCTRCGYVVMLQKRRRAKVEIGETGSRDDQTEDA